MILRYFLLLLIFIIVEVIFVLVVCRIFYFDMKKDLIKINIVM